MDDMTDHEALEQLLRRFGITPGRTDYDDPPPHSVFLVAKQGGVGGYKGFFAQFAFDDDGKFEHLAIWE